MKSLRRKLPFFFLLIFFTLSLAMCSKYANDPDLRLARDFIDAYYVMADQRAALNLVSGRAEEEIKKELNLLKGIEQRDQDYRTRDIVFDLKTSTKTDVEANYFYELRIIQPESGESERMIHIVVDRKSGRVKDFRNMD